MINVKKGRKTRPSFADLCKCEIEISKDLRNAAASQEGRLFTKVAVIQIIAATIASQDKHVAENKHCKDNTDTFANAQRSKGFSANAKDCALYIVASRIRVDAAHISLSIF